MQEKKRLGVQSSGVGFYGIFQFLIYLVCLVLLVETHLSSEAFLSKLNTTMLEFDSIRASDRQEINRLNDLLSTTGEKVSEYEVDIDRLGELEIRLQKELEDVATDFQGKESEYEAEINRLSEVEIRLQKELEGVATDFQRKESELQGLRADQNDCLENIKSLKENFTILQHEQQNTFSTMQGKIDSNNEIIQTHNVRVAAVEQERTQMLDDRRQLEMRVQEQSHYFANSSFGGGPHFVEFHVLFPPMERFDNKEMTGLFIVEIAPIDLMPHSVHVFLELIKSNFYVGTKFRLAFRHIVGISIPADEEPSGVKLIKTAFREYNDNFPHQRWTLGLMGKGSFAGPSFYISVVDNTKNNQGDPCVGGIVYGFDTIEAIQSMPVSGNLLDDPVEITQTRFISLDELLERIDQK